MYEIIIAWDSKRHITLSAKDLYAALRVARMFDALRIEKMTETGTRETVVKFATLR